MFTRALRSWSSRGAAPACVHMCQSVMLSRPIFEWGHLHGEWSISKRPHLFLGFWTHRQGLEQDCQRSQITQYSTVLDGESVRVYHIFYRMHICINEMYVMYSHGNAVQKHHTCMRKGCKKLKMHDIQIKRTVDYPTEKRAEPTF